MEGVRVDMYAGCMRWYARRSWHLPAIVTCVGLVHQENVLECAGEVGLFCLCMGGLMYYRCAAGAIPAHS